jgi:hypothetical protein
MRYETRTVRETLEYSHSGARTLSASPESKNTDHGNQGLGGEFLARGVSEIRPHTPGFGSIAIGTDTDSGLPKVPRNLHSLRSEDI